MRSMKIGLLMLAALAIGLAVAGCGSDETHGSEGTVTLTEPAQTGQNFGFIARPVKRSSLAMGLHSLRLFRIREGRPLANSMPSASQLSLRRVKHSTELAPARLLCLGGGFALNVGGKEIGSSVEGAIVGGTGKYVGALGTFTSKEESAGKGEEGPSTLTFRYTLP